MLRSTIIAVALLFVAEASAQQAFVVEISPDNYVGVLIAADGTVQPISKLTIIRPTNPVTTKVTKATYVYDKDMGPVPKHVAAALAKINVGGSSPFVADEFEIHNTTGTGQVPKQHQLALEAAKQTGLPCFVVERGSTVSVIKSPTTEDQVLEAVK